MGLSPVGTGLRRAVWSRVPGSREVSSIWCVPSLVWLMLSWSFHEPWLSNTLDKLRAQCIARTSAQPDLQLEVYLSIQAPSWVTDLQPICEA